MKLHEKWNAYDYSYLRPPEKVFEVQHKGTSTVELNCHRNNSKKAISIEEMAKSLRDSYFSMSL